MEGNNPFYVLTLLIMSDTNNTPQKAVELIDIPEKVKSALTQEEMNEVISARQKAVLKANVAERLNVLQ